MRMKRSRQRTVHLFNKAVTKDGEGIPNVDFVNKTEFASEIWPAGGKLQTETYGDRVNNMFNVKIAGIYTVVSLEHHLQYCFGEFTLSEGDCISLFSDKPDFKVVSIKPYNPLLLEVERL